jgi:Outer membrane protein beta-barrel domain
MRRICSYPTIALAITCMALPALFDQSLLAQTRAKRKTAEPRYEFGGGVSGSFYTAKDISNTNGSVKAGFKPGIGASMWLGNDMYELISGELRYDYTRQDMKLDGSGGKPVLGSHSHAVHYDIHFHFAERNAKIRPYVLAGGGVKMYQGTGNTASIQPMMNIAVLTATSDLKPMFTFGAGVKVKLNERFMLRFEFRDNISAFPKKLITPVRAEGGDGLVHNFLPTGGISLVF